MTALEQRSLALLRKESLDIFSRLHSIAEDILFVNQIREFYPEMPILPNLRCGAWYTDPTLRQWPALVANCPVYFKSTDGHFNNWSFTLRRPNLQLLYFVAAQKDGTGIILVDSTRAGKRIPDALSKTVPIWCAVINRAVKEVYPQGKDEWDTNLYTPPAAVSNQEHDQIDRRLDGWASALANSSYDLPNLPFPLRPIWITPTSSSFPSLAKDRTFLPIICLSASKQVQDGVERRSGGYAYVQGSGDDHELWGMGLTPDIFWQHRATLLDAERAELPTLVESLVAANAETRIARSAITPINKVRGLVLVCANSDLCEMPEPDVAHIIVGVHLPPLDYSGPNVLKIQTWEGKKGQFQLLQDVLPRSMEFIQSHLTTENKRICVSCDSGTDTSIGIAVAALAKFFNDAGDLVLQGDNGVLLVNKNAIRMRLEWIINSRPLANPSRTTLKRVNEYLLSSNSFRAPSSKPFPSL
ncbi:initiator tRNA phosphoribosyl transferase [Roridomyces roridus]|uniref:Initiator tRNA phosphoribosyl transferase n=1 Tax=Roridomyces roridus TaxID=1738132 RepID=A0AAD7FYZ1_9AGAR|nr:initiator tRNA phosphoribosyl transferase [Roridomyces roridus]